MPYVLITAPAAEPVTATEAKAQCRVTHSSDDTYFTHLIAAARTRCEVATGRALINQTWELRLDEWPYLSHMPVCDRNAIFITKPPVSSITSVKYLDTDGDEQTMVANTDYVVSLGDPITRIVPAEGTSWPSLQADTPDAIRVRFVTGYGAASTAVPSDLRSGILMLIEHFYRNRGDEVSGTITGKFDTASETLFKSRCVTLVG